MDELSAFKGASPALPQLESQLLSLADLVFTGGLGLYEAKRHRHSDVHAFPSAVDAVHFMKARGALKEPSDQCDIPRPRVGFYGVIDERFDRNLLAATARLRPDWQLILLGPVVKIDPESLPRAPNIYYLGKKNYEDLPAYVGNWDVAMMPFAINDATRFISPTKTPEYLAAGKPVVSTPIIDVVRCWGHLEAVRIATTPVEFIYEIERALSLPRHGSAWLEAVDYELAGMSWDRTWARMAQLVEDKIAKSQISARTTHGSFATNSFDSPKEIVEESLDV